jgi:hypothetical protein
MQKNLLLVVGSLILGGCGTRSFKPVESSMGDPIVLFSRLLATLTILLLASCGGGGSEDKGPFNGTLSVSPANLSFSGAYGSASVPAAQIFTISTTGRVWVAVDYGGACHEAAPLQLSGSTGTGTVGVNSPATAGPGIHTGVITVNGYLAATPGAPTATGSPAIVSVTYTVPGLTWDHGLGTAVLPFNQTSGGPLPAPRTITIRDALGASYGWTVTGIEYNPIGGVPNISWLEASPTSGAALPATLTLSVVEQCQPGIEYSAYVNLASVSPAYTLRVWVLYRAH